MGHESSTDGPIIASLHFFKYDRTLDLLRRTSARLKIDSGPSTLEFIEIISSSPTAPAKGSGRFRPDDSSSVFRHDSAACGSVLALAGVTLNDKTTKNKIDRIRIYYICMMHVKSAAAVAAGKMKRSFKIFKNSFGIRSFRRKQKNSYLFFFICFECDF